MVGSETAPPLLQEREEALEEAARRMELANRKVFEAVAEAEAAAQGGTVSATHAKEAAAAIATAHSTARMALQVGCWRREPRRSVAVLTHIT